MSLLQARQIHKLFGGYIRISNFAAAGASDIATSAITSALATAGFEGAALSVVPSTGEDIVGIVTTTSNNRTEIYSSSTKEKIIKDGNEIYGRLTESGGIYTLSYYYLDNGIETIHSFTPADTIDIEFVYRFELATIPTDIFIGISARNVGQDPSGGTKRVETNLLIVSAPNVVSDLTWLPDPATNVLLFVNGKEEDTLGTFPSFSVTNKQIFWNSANAGYSLATDDRVTARYTTSET